MITVSVTTHKSLLAEHHIKSLSILLVKHLSEVWSEVPSAMLHYKYYSTPEFDSFSPYELVFGHKMVLSHVLEIKSNVMASGIFKTYYEKLKKK